MILLGMLPRSLRGQYPTVMKIRLSVLATAVIGVGLLLLTGEMVWAAVLVIAYVGHLFMRDWLTRRARDRAWTDAGGEVYRLKGWNF